ncbi:unnamed protein product [Mytilus coruscus]|uniref:Uncharacterized protein n=1 Tax=Mytilus coruscus TaxID=42192 RepID=A0A6J8AKT3_MYTCO|nr:unnamed protein product [Mytilus coruscus]
MTRMHAFKEGRESMVVVILKDDMKKDKLPKALKEIWYKVVCIVWPTHPEIPYNSEEIFYAKLCIALSDRRIRISLIKATYSKINDQNANFLNAASKNLTSMPDFLQNSTTYLLLCGNFLQVVPVWSFQKLKKLRRLDLSNNLLRIIEREAFAGLVELTYLNLKTNKLTSNSLQKNIFQDLISLQYLAINNNLFNDEYTFLQAEISRVRSLDTLGIDLRGRDQISKCLCNLSKLQELQIWGLTGQTFSDNTFHNLKCLKIEILSLDSVISLAPDTFISLPMLRTLRIKIIQRLARYDIISSIFNSFKVFKGKNMTEISITNNPHRNGFLLGHTHFTVLQKICLQKLNLMGDSILGIQFGPFLRYGHEVNCLKELNINLMFDNKDSYVFAFCEFKHLKIIRIPHVIVRDSRIRGKRSTENDVSYTFCLPETLEQLDFHSNVKSYNRRRIANLTILNGSNLKVVNLANVTLRDCDGTINGIEKLEYFDMSGFH